MPENQLVSFSAKEIAERLVRERGITKGHWGLYVKFGLGGANVGDGASVMFPAAIVTVQEIGIQQFPEPNPLTVDASTFASSAPKKAKRK